MSKRVLEWALSCVRVQRRVGVLKRPILAFRATSAYAVMVVAIAFGAALASTQVQAAVGRTAGSHSVGNDASFNYTIAIFTPPGPRGMRGL